MSETALPVIRPWRRTGKILICMICKKEFYRRGSYIARGIAKTCGDPECKSASMRGENNPFWGKDHTETVKNRIRSSRLAKTGKYRRKMAPPKGYKHTPEARAAMSAAVKERWKNNRDKMMAHLADRPSKPRNEQRYRYCFTSAQRRLWTDTKCAWCDATEELVLDHIVPVLCGGTNCRENAQTLCMPCNRWKLKFVDRPLLLSGLVYRRG